MIAVIRPSEVKILVENGIALNPPKVVTVTVRETQAPQFLSHCWDGRKDWSSGTRLID